MKVTFDMFKCVYINSVIFRAVTDSNSLFLAVLAFKSWWKFGGL